MLTSIRRRRASQQDAGVIAIVVALSVSTFILGFAALAVDLGSAYTRKAELQAMADHLALAGAKGLPSTADALSEINKTLTGMCADNATPGICNADGSVAGTGWETDGSATNGQVSFFTDPDGDGRYRLADKITDLATPDVTAVKVLLPPSTVDFGLAGAVGVSSATLYKSATARIGTALGSGILPFALTPDDLALGQFCVKASPPVATTFPAWDGLAPPITDQHFRVDATTTTPTPLSIDPGGARLGLLTMTITPVDDNNNPTGTPRPADTQLSGVNIRFEHDDNPYPIADPSNGQYANVPIPPDEPGIASHLWVVGRIDFGDYHGSFTSTEIAIQYTGTYVPSTTLCDKPQSSRGYLNLARPQDVATSVPLRPNVRSGPTVHLFPVSNAPSALGGVLNCGATVFSPATTCLSAVTGTTFNTDLTSGLLRRSPDNPNIQGRLIGTCTGRTLATHGVGGVDASSLFLDGDHLIDLAHGSGNALQQRLTGLAGPHLNAGPDDQGWITSQSLQCPRMAVMPVVDHAFAGATQNIVGFRYVWIGDGDDTVHEGLNGDGAQVTSFQGYVIDPAYLPDLVSGSLQVGPYLGTGMPREALLIPDLGGPSS